MAEQSGDDSRKNLFSYHLIRKADPTQAYKIKNDDERMQIEWSSLDEQAKGVITQAFRIAMHYRHKMLRTEHLLLSLLNEPEEVVVQTLGVLGVEPDKLRQAMLGVMIPDEHGRLGDIPVTLHLNNALAVATTEAKRTHQGVIGTECLLLGVVQEHDEMTGEVLSSFGITSEELRKQFP